METILLVYRYFYEFYKEEGFYLSILKIISIVLSKLNVILDKVATWISFSLDMTIYSCFFLLNIIGVIVKALVFTLILGCFMYVRKISL